VKFTSDISGHVAGVRFYKYAQNIGTHTGSLWTASGTLLGTVTFTGETASGWQQATFATPIAITANTTYVVSYHTNTGYYAATAPGLTAAVNRAPLHALANSTPGGNGVYRYGTTSGFPNQSWNASNYWVDVVVIP
jgi:phospholipase C